MDVVNIFLPENFDIDRHIDAFPPFDNGFPDDVKFHSYKIGIFLNLLTSIPARNKDLISPDGFVNIHMATIRNSIKDILLYVNYLQDTGVIEINRQYFPGERSMRYKWAARFENSRFVARSIQTKYSHKESEYDYTSMSLPGYLSHWYDQKKLTIDPAALDYAWDVKETKMRDASKAGWDRNGSTGELKDPRIQYRAAILNISKIMDCNYGARFDNNVHRLHSVLTNIEKVYRGYLRYDDQPLVGVDIANSQPYLACLLLNLEFWKEDSALPLTIFNLPANITSRATHGHGMIPTVMDFLSGDIDFSDYIGLVASGKFYDEMMARVNEIPDRAPIDREQAKKMMFYALFSSNRGSNKDPVMNELKALFNSLFPNMAELFRIVKQVFDIDEEKQHNRLPVILQAIESEVVLQKCCRRIWEEQEEHNVPIFTIHDSIVTTEDNKDYVSDVMMQELTEHIGVKPTLKIEGMKK